MRLFIISILILSAIYADSVDEVMSGFDDEDIEVDKRVTKDNKDNNNYGVTGTLTQEIRYSPHASEPHNNISSLKTSLFLDYEYKFSNGFKFKTNGKGYYDSIYSINGRDDYSKDELDELESEIELFDAYVQGSITDKLDFKIGRQVVVWGRSDTIRVTDILNPIDNRIPAMVDIEDLRLPVTMAKLDYFLDDWRITPIAILEQRFTKNPPFRGGFNPSPKKIPEDKSYSDITPALSIGGEFSNWDINFYASQFRDDNGVLDNKKIAHNRVNMLGTALNFLSGSWLFKSEIAYFDKLKFTTTKDREFKKSKILLGSEYNGIKDSIFSYDILFQNINNYDNRLSKELIPIKKRLYQHAFRASSDFLNATLKANFLISLYGAKLDEGGFGRVWFDYDIADGISSSIGFVDYRGGSTLFDKIRDEDRVFGAINYSF